MLSMEWQPDACQWEQININQIISGKHHNPQPHYVVITSIRTEIQFTLNTSLLIPPFIRMADVDTALR